MITEELKNLVREEARNLREKATREELENLDFKNLYPCSITECIYGMMTGDCYSDRATSLIKQCCSKVIEGGSISYCEEIIGSPLEYSRGAFWSPIEKYITEDEANSKGLISYLKGETETLDL
jgi:hypothetical protein